MLNIWIHQIFNHIDLSPQIPDPGQAATNQQEKTCESSTQKLSERERLRCSIPRSDHHIDEEWQQVIHAPQEVAVQHGSDFLGQLLKGLLNDDEFVRWSKGGAARDILSLTTHS